MFRKNIKLIAYISLTILISFCSNNKKLENNKAKKVSETIVLEKQKHIQKDSLENLKKEILQLKKKKDSIMNKNKGILEKKQ
jgi:hypothetical protein